MKLQFFSENTVIESEEVQEFIKIAIEFAWRKEARVLA